MYSFLQGNQGKKLVLLLIGPILKDQKDDLKLRALSEAAFHKCSYEKVF